MKTETISDNLGISAATSRRQVLKRIGLGAAGLTGLNFLSSTALADKGGIGSKDRAQDIAVLQFALNLEYLEAEYYIYGVTGSGIEQAGASIFGSGTQGPTLIKANPLVPFADMDLQQYAREIAQDELTHVIFLRAALQSLGATPAAKPTIDLLGSWNALAQAAGIGASFDPFANEVNFLLGAFVFEDAGVTAYRGGAPLLSDKTILSAAAGLLGTEAYHAGIIRSELFDKRTANPGLLGIVQKISDTRDLLDGPGDMDQGLLLGGQANLVPTDPNGLVFARTVQQVLNIVYFAQDATSGGFFPNGINPGVPVKGRPDKKGR